jgi:hypothetical protein
MGLTMHLCIRIQMGSPTPSKKSCRDFYMFVWILFFCNYDIISGSNLEWFHYDSPMVYQTYPNIIP